jgi:hypothetical protein
METTTPDLCQSRTMMVQGQQMQMLANTQVGTTTTSANMAGLTQTKSAGTSNALSQFMLQSTVEPFQRGNASSGDDEDLWKVFDDEVSTGRLICDPHLNYCGVSFLFSSPQRNSTFPTTMCFFHPSTSSFSRLVVIQIAVL